MTRTIRLRNVPDELVRVLRVRAAAAGLSLSDYLLAELRRVVQRPTRRDVLARIAQRAPVRSRVRSADAVRAERR